MNRPSPPRAVLFDIDGTLIDSNELHVKAWIEAFNEAGHAITTERICGQIGKGGDNLVPALLPGVGDGEEKRLSERQGAIFKTRYLAEARPFPGAADLLRKVHADGWQVVLASSAKDQEIAHYIGLLGVDNVITARASSDDVNNSKPAPDIFETALRKAKVAAENGIVVGDTIWDIKAARRAGVRAVALLSGGNGADALETAGATGIYTDVTDILARYETSLFAS